MFECVESSPLEVTHMALIRTVLTVLALAAGAVAFAPLTPRVLTRGGAMQAVEITKGVEFDTVAREWRMKWSPEDDKKSLQEAQAVLDATLAEVKALPGVNSVQRIVCGGCLDFKVVTSMALDDFNKWEANDFAPESSFLEKVKAIDGITFVETQTFTLMPM